MAREFNSVNTVKSAPKNKSFLDRMKDKIAKNQERRKRRKKKFNEELTEINTKTLKRRKEAGPTSRIQEGLGKLLPPVSKPKKEESNKKPNNRTQAQFKKDYETRVSPKRKDDGGRGNIARRYKDSAAATDAPTTSEVMATRKKKEAGDGGRGNIARRYKDSAAATDAPTTSEVMATRKKKTEDSSKTSKAKPAPKDPTPSKVARSIAEAKRMGVDTFTNKAGKELAAVTKEELDASGMSLRDYLNKQQGKTRRGMKKGGAVKKPFKTGDLVKAKPKAKKKIRGAGKEIKGLRPCKMR